MEAQHMCKTLEDACTVGTLLGRHYPLKTMIVSDHFAR